MTQEVGSVTLSQEVTEKYYLMSQELDSVTLSQEVTGQCYFMYQEVTGKYYFVTRSNWTALICLKK
jgi:hypothetical protein